MIALLLMAGSSVLILGAVIWVDHRMHVPPIRAGFLEGFRRVTPRQAVVAIVIQAYLLALVLVDIRDAFPLVVFGLIVAASAFLRLWAREFAFLMALRDSDFPGRHDKVIWAVVLLALAPLGVWAFRAFRLEHWPVESALDAHLDEAAPRKPAVAPLS